MHSQTSKREEGQEEEEEKDHPHPQRKVMLTWGVSVCESEWVGFKQEHKKEVTAIPVYAILFILKDR